MLRMGSGMTFNGTDPRLTGGQFYLVLNGSLHYDGANFPVWSTVYAGPADEALSFAAGGHGLEALILNFPRTES